MRTVKINFQETNESEILCGEGVFAKELAPMRESLERGGGFVFTDSNVSKLYGDLLKHSLGEVPMYAMPAGEEQKNESTLFSLLKKMADAGLRRNSTLIAVGGGVVGDIGGLAASLYMRGISCIQVPTTLLAQVDASVGGKTAIDFCGVKNLIGAFKQPAKVLADPLFLKTLPMRELKCGLGEIIKHGALSAELFERLLAAPDLFDLNFLAEIIPENIAFKADIVKRDPFEKGLRKCLNLGHTTGHAVELGSALSHGECVLIGMIYEAEIARRLTACDGAYLDKLQALCRSVCGDALKINVAEAAEWALYDKKNTKRNQVVLTVPTRPGEYVLLELAFGDYLRALKEIGKNVC